MEETNSSLVFIEKNTDNEDISIIDDYEILNSIYPDEIKEIKNNQEALYFLLKLKHEIEIQNSTIELLHSMKFDDLLNCNNDNCMYLPYWIKIFYSKENKLLKISCYVFWFKYEKNNKEQLKEKLTGDIDEPILYNIIEETKAIIETTLNDKRILIDLLSEIKKLIMMKVHTTSDNFLLNITGANDDIEEDFEYEEAKLWHPSNNNEKNDININKSKKEGKISTEQNNLKNNDKKDDDKKEDFNYEKFFEDGGFVGETITDRGSTFQAHAIKIKNKKEYDFYRKCLLTQKKIKKATHNITAYRCIVDNSNQIIEDYDDDGEHGAGIRVLGILQKMELINLFVMVTRWYGGILLHQDRFKRINDSAQNLLNQHFDVFKSKNKK